jgi:hypothetical protein
MEQDKTPYEEPTIAFLLNRFKNTPFGTLRPAELELLLFYVLAWHNNDLQKSEYELARQYLITETKAARFKVEIARRFAVSQNTKENMRQLAKAIFEDRDIIPEWEGGARIAVPVYDPNYLLSFKQTLAENHIPYDTGTNGNLIKLTTANFIAVFARSGYGEIKKQIKGVITAHKEHEETYQAIFASGEPLSTKVKGFLQEYGVDILSAIPVIKEIMPPVRIAAKIAGAATKSKG